MIVAPSTANKRFAACSRLLAAANRLHMAGTHYEMAGRSETEHKQLRDVAEAVFECSLVRGYAMLGEYKLAGSKLFDTIMPRAP